VTIGFRAIKSKTPEDRLPGMGEPIENYVPDQFNNTSTTTVELKSDGTNVLVFDLKSP
jgi:hypothetical protein